MSYQRIEAIMVTHADEMKNFPIEFRYFGLKEFFIYETLL